MISDTYGQLDALSLAEMVRRKEVTPDELVEEAIRRIDEINPRINAVILRLYDMARRTAKGPLPDGAFCGVPFLLKDAAIAWQGVPVTNACKYLSKNVAGGDWEAVRRIKRAGFVLVGKSNAPENGWSLTTEPKLYGATRNPWNDQYSAGGSSGGSAAAVAARLVPIADASDGAGSIRVPAANTGLVGLKPSRGRISLGPDYVDFFYGGAVFLCVSRTVRDTAAYLDALGGALPGEPYALPMPEASYLSAVSQRPPRLRIAFSTTAPGGDSVHEENRAAVEKVAKQCSELGHEVVERFLDVDYAAMFDNYVRVIAVLTAAGFAEAAKSVGRPVTASDVEPTTWAIIERGRSIGGVEHALQIEKLRRDGREIAGILAPYDVYITPTIPVPPRLLGWFDMSESDVDRYNAKMRADCAFTSPFNMSGQPAMSLPLHWTADNLPVGVQLAGRIGDERTLIMLGGQLEQAMPWLGRCPPISA
jgi:amidase